ncbi:MAG: dipeptidase [Bacteroidales bacterium]|nr:dipeptidase [Bacteroidales bacterium]MCF8338045.1 dipeptidase [Bacteroidales bacterium]
MQKLILIFSTAVIVFFAGCRTNSSQQKIIDEVNTIHEKVLTLDSHSDTPLWFLSEDYNFGERHNAQKTGNRIDLPRMEEGGLDAVFLAAYVGQGPLDKASTQEVYRKANRIIDSIHTTAARHSEKAALALTPEDAYRLKKEGKKALFIGLENGYPLGTDLSKVKHFYNRGVRYITLSHTSNNEICDSSTDTARHNGLSAFGKKVVKEMNRLGIMVDVSHISDSSFYDVLKVSDAPVIASHSNARAVREHPRNLSDSMLTALAENGGVIQVCVLSDYVKKTPDNPARDSAYKALRKKYNGFKDLSKEEEQKARDEWRRINRQYPKILADVEALVDHIDHIVEVAGIDHVGIGSDFDGGGALEGVYDVSEFKNITAELLKRDYSHQQIKKIWGGNFMRVFRKVVEEAKTEKAEIG